MKKLIKVFIAFGIVTMISIHANSQDYRTAIGVRLGGLTSGLSVKGFMNPTSAIEGILGFGYGTSVITGLYEKHNYINDAPGLKWFYGGGAHLGFFGYGAHYYYYTPYGDRVYVAMPGETTTVGGLDFILGLDYKIPRAPFSIGIDMKPFVDFFDMPALYFDGALSLRFAF